MIDVKVFSLIDDRLRSIFPATSHQPFGGLNVLLCGDFSQLAPVAERPLYSLIPSNLHAMKGSQLYPMFNKTVRLVQVMRQEGEGEVSTRFRIALSELRSSRLSPQSWQLLSSRVMNGLSPDEVATFDSALRLYYTKEEVRMTDLDRLAAENRPVMKNLAHNKGRITANSQGYGGGGGKLIS